MKDTHYATFSKLHMSWIPISHFYTVSLLTLLINQRVYKNTTTAINDSVCGTQIQYCTTHLPLASIYLSIFEHLSELTYSYHM